MRRVPSTRCLKAAIADIRSSFSFSRYGVSLVTNPCSLVLSMAAKRRRLDMESLALEESVQKRIAASYLINFREYSPAEAAAATGYTRASDAALWAKRLRSACTPYKQWGKRRGPAPIMTEQDADALGEALYDDPMGTGVGRVASTLNMPDVSTSTLYRGLIAHDWRGSSPIAARMDTM